MIINIFWRQYTGSELMEKFFEGVYWLLMGAFILLFLAFFLWLLAFVYVNIIL